MKKIISMIVGIFAIASIIYAGNVEMAWDASTSPEVNRYKIYAVQGTNTVFTTNNANAVATLVVTNQLTATMSNLTVGAWTFVATAISTNNLESDNSNVVWGNVPPKGVVNLRIIRLEAK